MNHYQIGTLIFPNASLFLDRLKVNLSEQGESYSVAELQHMHQGVNAAYQTLKDTLSKDERKQLLRECNSLRGEIGYHKAQVEAVEGKTAAQIIAENQDDAYLTFERLNTLVRHQAGERFSQGTTVPWVANLREKVDSYVHEIYETNVDLWNHRVDRSYLTLRNKIKEIEIYTGSLEEALLTEARYAVAGDPSAYFNPSAIEDSRKRGPKSKEDPASESKPGVVSAPPVKNTNLTEALTELKEAADVPPPLPATNYLERLNQILSQAEKDLSKFPEEPLSDEDLLVRLESKRHPLSLLVSFIDDELPKGNYELASQRLKQASFSLSEKGRGAEVLKVACQHLDDYQDITSETSIFERGDTLVSLLRYTFNPSILEEEKTGSGHHLPGSEDPEDLDYILNRSQLIVRNHPKKVGWGIGLGIVALLGGLVYGVLNYNSADAVASRDEARTSSLINILKTGPQRTENVSNIIKSAITPKAATSVAVETEDQDLSLDQFLKLRTGSSTLKEPIVAAALPTPSYKEVKATVEEQPLRLVLSEPVSLEDALPNNGFTEVTFPVVVNSPVSEEEAAVSLPPSDLSKTENTPVEQPLVIEQPQLVVEQPSFNLEGIASTFANVGVVLEGAVSEVGNAFQHLGEAMIQQYDLLQTASGAEVVAVEEIKPVFKWTIKSGDRNSWLSVLGHNLCNDSRAYLHGGITDYGNNPNLVPVGTVVKVPCFENYVGDTHTIVKGDTLWTLAERIYGDATKWKVLAKINDIRDPTKLRVGKVLRY